MKRSPINSRSTSERRRLEVEADTFWQKAIAAMWRGRCMWKPCENEGTVGHHLRSRKFRETRHSILNGVLLCHEHHAMAHSNKPALDDYLKKSWPVIYAFQETIKAIPPRRVSSDDLKNTFEELRKFTRRMEEENAGKH